MASTFAQAQSAAILMDGRFNDWSPGLVTLSDPDVPAGGVDLRSMQVTNDEQYLFIKLVLGAETDLLDDLTPQTIRLYIDGDNNAGTGLAAQTGYGAELQIRFDTRTVTEYWGTSSNVSWSTLDLVPLPTVTSDTFEIAIARNAVPDGTNALFTSNTIKLLFRETDGGDAMPNSGSTFSYTFDNTAVPPLVPIPVPKANAAHLRILAYNVLNDGITNAGQQAVYQRILTALDPDVIGFSECVSSTAVAVKTRLDSWIPLGGAGWYVVKDDYDMIVAARWPIVQSWPALSRQFPTLIDLPATYSTDLLFTAAHLNCCTADATRQNQADAYVQFVQDAKTPGGVVDVPFGTPMVYAGDLNLVGYAQQLRTLLTGDIQNNATYGPDGAMDWDGSPATDAICRHTDARMAYTWRSATSAYPAGRLDFILYTDAVATAARSFSLRTATMPAATLAALGLQAGDVDAASDHYPVITDLIMPQANIAIQVKALLEGPYENGNALMHDSLRTRAFLPPNEPYTALGFTQVGGGGEEISSSVLTTNGPNAIVDWVLLELRASGTPSTVVATRSCLLQRDGDVVDLDGSSPVQFNIGSGTYHVAVRHRNHLGVMTASALALSASPVMINLTQSSTLTYGTEARKTVGSNLVMWAGNCIPDTLLKYTGDGNDRDGILARIGGVIPTNTAVGYWSTDVNMDGLVKYTGALNDRDPILTNIGGLVPTSTRAEQLP